MAGTSLNADAHVGRMLGEARVARLLKCDDRCMRTSPAWVQIHYKRKRTAQFSNDPDVRIIRAEMEWRFNRYIERGGVGGGDGGGGAKKPVRSCVKAMMHHHAWDRESSISNLLNAHQNDLYRTRMRFYIFWPALKPQPFFFFVK
jgi:hypothetical protein